VRFPDLQGPTFLWEESFKSQVVSCFYWPGNCSFYPYLSLIFSFWCFRYQAGCTATDNSNSCHFISQVFQGNRQCRLWQLCKLLFYQLLFSLYKEMGVVHASIMSIYNSNEGPDTFLKVFNATLWWQCTGIMLVWLPVFQRNILPSSLILSVITHRIFIYLFGILIDYYGWKIFLDWILSIMNNFTVCAILYVPMNMLEM